MKDFRKLIVWQKGMEIVLSTYELSKQLPTEEKFSLVSQMTRAAISIPSNIAEGSGRTSDKEKGRFAEIALGSAFELETHLLIIKELKIASENDCDTIIENLHEEQRMINALIRTYAKYTKQKL